MNSIKLALNPRFTFSQNNTPLLKAFSVDHAKNVLAFHQSFSEYAPTPLVSLNALATKLEVGEIYVKDESKRFGLNAFKALGSAYAISKFLRQQNSGLLAGKTTFVTATDGNHGLGVAWVAKKLGQHAVVYMPKGSAKIRADNILKMGAECIVTDKNYDDTVRQAHETSRKNNWPLIQDTAWKGYEEIPLWIMQGYMSIASEIHATLQCKLLPTHLFLQAGVGSFAAAILGYFFNAMKEAPPKVIIVEPNQANCIYQSILVNDEKPHVVTGELDTLMAGLSCGEPCSLAWDIIKNHALAAISCPDWIAANGMRILSSPRGEDTRIISGESGAVSCGLLDYIMRVDKTNIKKKLALTKDSRVLLISTEGDTAPALWQNIVHYGAYPAPVH